jgi:hypothetical protein
MPKASAMPKAHAIRKAPAARKAHAKAVLPARGARARRAKVEIHGPETARFLAGDPVETRSPNAVHPPRAQFVGPRRPLVASAWQRRRVLPTVHSIDTPPPPQEPHMSTPRTARFTAHDSTARRVAAGLALVLTMGIVATLDQVADRQYDEALMAEVSESTPVQLVIVTASRLPQA